MRFHFDDGPGSYSEELARTLLSHESKATFFELGNRMKYNQDTVKTLYGYGMEIGSHTYAHKNLNKLSDEEIDEEISVSTFQSIIGMFTLDLTLEFAFP